MERGTDIELSHVVGSNGLALVAELIEEEEPTEAVLPDEGGEAEKRERSEGAERELNDGVVGAGVSCVTGGAGEEEMGGGGDSHGEEEEDEPGEGGGEEVGLVDAHPSEVGSEGVELVVHVRNGAVVVLPLVVAAS